MVNSTRVGTANRCWVVGVGGRDVEDSGEGWQGRLAGGRVGTGKRRKFKCSEDLEQIIGLKVCTSPHSPPLNIEAAYAFATAHWLVWPTCIEKVGHYHALLPEKARAESGEFLGSEWRHTRRTVNFPRAIITAKPGEYTDGRCHRREAIEPAAPRSMSECRNRSR